MSEVYYGPADVKEGENVFGVAHIYASFNDTFVHVTDLSGKETIIRVTGACLGEWNNVPCVDMRVGDSLEGVGAPFFFSSMIGMRVLYIIFIDGVVLLNLSGTKQTDPFPLSSLSLTSGFHLHRRNEGQG